MAKKPVNDRAKHPFSPEAFSDTISVSRFPQFATLGVSARAQLAWLHLAAMLGPALATLTESGMRPETTRER